jgi:hypothetical protein
MNDDDVYRVVSAICFLVVIAAFSIFMAFA